MRTRESEAMRAFKAELKDILNNPSIYTTFQGGYEFRSIWGNEVLKRMYLGYSLREAKKLWKEYVRFVLNVTE